MIGFSKESRASKLSKTSARSKRSARRWLTTSVAGSLAIAVIGLPVATTPIHAAVAGTEQRPAVAVTSTILAAKLPTVAAGSPQGLIPSGLTLDKVQKFTFNKAQYAVVTTMGIAPEPAPWLIMAKQTAKNVWTPLFVEQTDQAFRTTQILVGPKVGQTQSIVVSFMVDGATGRLSNIYTLALSNNSVSVAKELQNVVEAYPVKIHGNAVEVDAYNLQVTEHVSSNGTVTVQSTPLINLLNGATHEVGFVLGNVETAHGTTALRTSIIGSTQLQAKVGDTISFLPLNSMAKQNLLGAYENLGKFTGISIYTTSGTSKLQFAAVNQVMSNLFQFSQPGTYTFAIVPPTFKGFSPDANVAQITVKVTK